MMNQPLIHIGYPKTGTTFFQKILFPNHPQIRLFSIKSPGSAWIEDIYEPHDLRFDAAGVLAAYETQMQAADGLVPVVSQESLIGDVFSRTVNFQRNAQRLHSIFPQGKILIIIREQQDMILSLYHQYCQEGGTMRLGRWLSDRAPNHFDRATLDYAALLECYHAIFGEDQVKMMPFEHYKQDPLEFVTQMMAFCDLDAPPEMNQIISSKPINVRSTRYGLHFMRLANRFVGSQFNPSPIIPRPLIWNLQLRKITNNRLEPWLFQHLPLANKTVKIPDALQQELIAFYAPGNRALSEKYGLPLENYGYPM